MSKNLEQSVTVITGFKAGTVLLDEIITNMTGLIVNPPENPRGEKKYYDENYLTFKKDHYFRWHLIPTEIVIEKLNQNNTKTIFLVRNLYDVVISIYYHFYNNIDHEVGKANNKDKFLKQFTFEEGVSLIITGFDENGLRWNGMQEIIDHYNCIFKAKFKCDSIIINYDDILTNKANIITKIADFLDISVTDEKIQELITTSDFDNMKKSKLNKSHFREGKASFNRTKLSEYHKIQLRQMIKLTAPDIYENAKKVSLEKVVNI